MCDFCENIKNQKNFKLDLEVEGELFYNSKEHKYYIVLNDVQESYYNDLEIGFCPMCGRKLGEETEKPSTEELLATLKEKMTEDDYKKLNDSMKSFSDGINGLWEVLRKGIENEETEN